MSRILISLSFMFLAITTLGQQKIQHARQKSWQSLVYRVPADTAEKYLKNEKAQPGHYLNSSPFAIWHADTARYDKLPIGNYIIFSVVKDELLIQYHCQSRIKIFPINDQHRVQLEIRDSTGRLMQAANVWVNGKQIPFNTSSQTFILKNKRPDEARIKVCIPGDTLFMDLLEMEEMEQTTWQQWWSNFGYTKAGRIIKWPMQKVKNLFNSGRYYRRAKNKNTNYGYMLFSQPKYKPGDTLRLKAYILNKRKKPYRKPLDLYLDYQYRGSSVSKKIASPSPETPGAFVYEMILGDSLESDRRYTVTWKEKKRVRYSGQFTIDDYLLDEVAEYGLRSEKEKYRPSDTLIFYANAKDANGLGLMDGKVSLTLLADHIDLFSAGKVWVPDTLWTKQVNLLSEGDTKIEIPASALPAADLRIKVKAVFTNSNHETQNKEIMVKYANQHHQINVSLEEGWIFARYFVNGIEKNQSGLLWKEDGDSEKIQFPFQQKIDPFLNEYRFSAVQDTIVLAKNDYEPEPYAYLQFQYHQEEGASGFRLSNPHRLLVHYSVFNGRQLVDRGSDTAAVVVWAQKIKTGKMYRVEWNYIWGGKEYKGSQDIAALNKLLRTEISGASVVFPGKRDTITVAVRDNKGKLATGVNLTAVSYNSQFQKDIDVKEPPYLQRFRLKRRIVFDNYELEEADFSRRLALGEYRTAIKAFSLDTMLYYQLLFPKDSFAKVSQRISEFEPQLSVYAVQKGKPQPIYLLYINNRFTWYHGSTIKAGNAFGTERGYTKIAMRLKDRMIEIDSIYLQAFYKHDIVFDIDKLPLKAKITLMEPYYSAWERQQLESTIMQIPSDYRHNDGWIWQGDRVGQMYGNRNHLAGPFRIIDSVYFYKPGSFDISFAFESGYQYHFSPKMIRLEKTPLFSSKKKIALPALKPNWELGDTILPPPVINYTVKPVLPPYLQNTPGFYTTVSKRNYGRLKVELPADSSFRYTVLYKVQDDTTIARVLPYGAQEFGEIAPGLYYLVYITPHYQYLEVNDLEIKEHATLCLKITRPVYTSSSEVIKKVRQHQEEQRRKALEPFMPIINRAANADKKAEKRVLKKGTAGIWGVVTDKAGKLPIAGASVFLRDFNVGNSTDANGVFSITGLPAGKYKVLVSSVAYITFEMEIVLLDDQLVNRSVEMEAGSENLGEVVVVGYGISKKKSLTASVTSVKAMEITSALQGRVPGISVTGNPGAGSRIQIRGLSSFSGGSKPLYIIDGLPVEELPDGMDLKNVQMTVIKDAIATSLYGARAANGVVIINTGVFLNGGLRETFRDYAFWVPNLVTDKNGEAKFAVTYPDNITSWQTFVVGMDKKKRITKTSVLVKSFKPLLAQLAAPSFLTEGDSAIVIGKVFNYTSAPATVDLSFGINKNASSGSKKEIVNGNGSYIDYMPVTVHSPDTLLLQYQLQEASGYRDGELRRIPVVRRGIEEVNGQFWTLLRDSAFIFSPDTSAGPVQIFAQHNTLDVFLDELKGLEDYPYFCMEQTASKLKGLLMEQRIRKFLNQPFGKEKLIQQLLKKLQEGQLFNGGWSWWGGGTANMDISLYIMEALLLVESDPLVRTNIRNAVLYIQNHLLTVSKYKWPALLLGLSDAGHTMDYLFYLSKLPFDSLTLHQQWQVIKIRQQQKLPYASELDTVMKKRKQTMTGGLYWGEDSYYWASNGMATTILAYKVWEKEKGGDSIYQRIANYFLEQRKQGRWRNTVESANVVATVLPSILAQQQNFTDKYDIKINGMPLTEHEGWAMSINGNEPVQITKSGGGMTYLTAWQKKFNTNPLPVTDKFVLHTWFERDGVKVNFLQAGETAQLKVTVHAKADAEYVMIEVPIPAGCTYAEKSQQGYNVHKEYLKNKVVIFAEKMHAGEHQFSISLEPRYSGVYQLNPASAGLMYFPVFHGRNEMKTAVIKN